MKVILVGGDDYSALTFEQSEMSITEAYDKAVEKGGEFELDDGDGFFKVNAFEFGEVDKEFVKFIKNNIEDYDMAKNQTFYVVDETL